jgi:uncharacterized membrane protein
MFRTAKASMIAIALTGSALAFTAGPAQAVTDFPSCAAMHRVWHHGVARSVRAANFQVRTGHDRPAVKPAVYRVNNESDADKDGTACEVSH